MHSISRAFFFSLGTILFLVLGLFWIGLALDFSALENFIINLCYSRFIGYTIPQVLGAESSHTVVEQVFRLKIICTLVVALYGSLMLLVSNVKVRKTKLLILYYSIVIPLLFALSYVWIKLINDDHILLRSHKVELSQFTILSLIISVTLILLSLKKEKSKLAESVKKIPTADELKIDLENSPLDLETSSAEAEKSASSIVESEGAEEPSSDTPKTVEKEKTEQEVESPQPDALPKAKEDTGNSPVIDTKDDDLPPPALDELPAELEELRDESKTDEKSDVSSESSESPQPDALPEAEEDTGNSPVIDKKDDDLSPPALDELPAELEELRDESKTDKKSDVSSESSELEMKESDQ